MKTFLLGVALGAWLWAFVVPPVRTLAYCAVQVPDSIGYCTAFVVNQVLSGVRGFTP